MNDVELLKLAVVESEKSSESLKCGVIIAKAGEKLKSKNLADCVIYCSCEPCVMCLAVI